MQEKITENYKRNIRLDITYNGYKFHGFQSQKHKTDTIQGEIKKTLDDLFIEGYKFYGASRTDAGVHAYGQVANVLTNNERFSSEELLKILNKRLPGEIFIKNVSEAELSFNARFSAKGKHYQYRIRTGEQKPVFDGCFVYYYPFRQLNIPSMQYSAKLIEGTHDFSSFGSNSDKPDENKIRHVSKIEIKKVDNSPLIYIDVFGESFLYKMVRGICGTLLEIGRGKKIDINAVFEAKDRSVAGRNLPPYGLFLMEVFY